MESWGGAGEGTPPQRWAFQQRMQVSQREQKGALRSTVNFLLDYHIWSLQLIILGETKDLAFQGYGEQRGHQHFVYFVAQHTQKSLKDLPTGIDWNNGGERARGQASPFKPCGTHLTCAPSTGRRALPREASPHPGPCPGGLAGGSSLRQSPLLPRQRMRTANLRRVRNSQHTAGKCFMDGGRMQPGRRGINGDGKKPVTVTQALQGQRGALAAPAPPAR